MLSNLISSGCPKGLVQPSLNTHSLPAKPFFTVSAITHLLVVLCLVCFTLTFKYTSITVVGENTFTVTIMAEVPQQVSYPLCYQEDPAYNHIY